jgi:hypothetical protein
MDQYFYNIRDFALKSNSTPWQLDRFDVATKLLRILNNPDIINQDGFGLCGEVSFLRAWVSRDPISVVQFVTELFENGNANIGSYQVQAADVLLRNDYILKEPYNLITSAVWMICGALADTEDDLVSDFDGNPPGGSSTGTYTWELKNWLDATKLYSSIDANLCAFNEKTGTILTSVLTGIPGLNFSDSQTIDDLIKQLEPYHPPAGSQYTQMDVFLAINSNMFRNLISCYPPDDLTVGYHGFLKGIVSSHWIMLDEPVEDLGNEQVRLSIWTWGKKYKIVLTKDAFNSDYYGSIRAHAYENRRSITPKSLSPVNEFAGTVDSWYSQQRTLEIDWWAYNDNIEWFNVGDTLDNPLPVHIWYNKSMQNHVSMPIPDPVDPHSHRYYLNAFNCWSTDPSKPAPNSVASDIVQPDCRTETQHFHFSYFCYNSPHQILDGDSHKGVEVKSSYGDRLLGQSYPDGRMEIVGSNQMIPINLESNTPDFVASIAIALEYCYYWLTGSPFRLQDPGNGKKINVLIRTGAATSATFDINSGYGIMTFDSKMKYEDIPLVALNGLIDLIQRAYSPHHGLTGDIPWDIPPRYVIQDALLDLNKYFPLLQSFVQHPEVGLKDEKGAAAFWAYIGLGAGDPQGIIRSKWEKYTDIDFLPDSYVNFIYSDMKKDVYNDDTVFGNFVLATACLLLAQAPIDSRFNFGSYQASLPKPPATSNKLSSQMPVIFQGSLLTECSMAFHVLNLDSDVSNVAVSFQGDIGATSAKSLLQIVLLDASDTIIDVIKTDKSQYDRTIGLRGATVKKILIALANCKKPSNSNGFEYVFQATAAKSACDVMITRWNRPVGRELVDSMNVSWDTPDIWLTSDDPAIGRDIIDVQNETDWSIVHVQLHNFGNQDAQQVRVNLYFQTGSFSPSDADWQAMQLDGLPNGLIMKVPANGICELTARWFYPIRNKTSLEKKPISIAAELQSLEDLSLDNNRATKTHAYTNALIEKLKPPEDIIMHHGPSRRPLDPGLQLDKVIETELRENEVQTVKPKEKVPKIQRLDRVIFR